MAIAHRRRRLFLLLVLLLIVGGLLLVPSVRWPLYGWLRGEAFYQGMPTSYWRKEIEEHYQLPPIFSSVAIVGYHKPRGHVDQWVTWLGSWVSPSTSTPVVVIANDPFPLVEGDINGLPVLLKLLASDKPRTRLIAIYGMGNIGPAAQEAVPAILETSRTLDPWDELAALLYLHSIDPEAAARARIK